MEESENIEENTKPPEKITDQDATADASSENHPSEVQPQNLNMEVHTHSHTPRKKWSHYFWEFLMLFLAVFCGFLAEYKLEHVIENQREETLMHSLTEDLHADETTIANYINWRTEVNNDFDSLLLLLSKQESDSSAYIVYQKSYTAILRFGLPDIYEGTIQQLKNAGGLRLVRKKEVINAINKHYLGITRLKSIYDIEILLRVKLSETMAEVLDAKTFIDKNLLPESYRLLTNDKGKINNFMNSILSAKQINQRLINQLEATRKSAVNLNELVKAEYRF